ncbi:hypothetical protein ABPG72_006198 [Tetrahymena utriculariae]
MQLLKSQNKSQESFLSILQSQGKIKVPMLSLFLNQQDDSKITLGGFDPTSIQDLKKIYHKVFSKSQTDDILQWAIRGNKLKIGSFSAFLNTTQKQILISSVDQFIWFDALSHQIIQRILKLRILFCRLQANNVCYINHIAWLQQYQQDVQSYV